MIRTSSALSVALVFPAILFAQEKYTVKLKHSGTGDAVVHSRKNTKTESVVVTAPGGNVVQEKKQTTVEVDKYKDEIFAKAAGQRPTKLTRTYTEASIRTDDQLAKQAYDGKEVSIEKKADGYHFTIDGKELTGEEAGDLTRQFDAKKGSDDEMDKLMLPAKPVAVGDSWKIDGTKLAKLLGDEKEATKDFDLPKAKATGKLTKAYKKDGRQFGVLEFHFEVPLKSIKGMYNCREGAKMTLSIVADACIDGAIEADTATIKSKASGTADHAQDGQKTGYIIKFDVESVEKETTTTVKK